MHYIYRVILQGGYTYVGVAQDMVERSAAHQYYARKGKLGQCKVPPTIEVYIEIIASAAERFDAKIIEARCISQDRMDNPLRNCNKIVGRANGFTTDDRIDQCVEPYKSLKRRSF